MTMLKEQPFPFADKMGRIIDTVAGLLAGKCSESVGAMDVHDLAIHAYMKTEDNWNSGKRPPYGFEAEEHLVRYLLTAAFRRYLKELRVFRKQRPLSLAGHVAAGIGGAAAADNKESYLAIFEFLPSLTDVEREVFSIRYLTTEGEKIPPSKVASTLRERHPDEPEFHLSPPSVSRMAYRIEQKLTRHLAVQGLHYLTGPRRPRRGRRRPRKRRG